MQSMSRAYWPSVCISATFLVWTHTHTDEIPVVLGFVLLLSILLTALFPQHFIVSAAVTGVSLFCAEILVYFSILKAPYPAGQGVPWAALTGYVPALLGMGLGLAIRDTTARTLWHRLRDHQ